MGIYTRFKRAPGGFRNLVELLESTPMSRRTKMIEAGMAEDPDYTERALQYVMTFQDIIELSDLELAELVAETPPRIIAYAIRNLGEDVKTRFLRNARGPVMAEIKDYLSVETGLKETGGAQLKVIEYARKLERRGAIKKKKIPLSED